MIGVDYATVKVQGTKIGLMAELATLINSLHTKDILSKEDIEYCVKIALLSERELAEETGKLDKKREEEDSDEDDSSKEEPVDLLADAMKLLFGGF